MTRRWSLAVIIYVGIALNPTWGVTLCSFGTNASPVGHSHRWSHSHTPSGRSVGFRLLETLGWALSSTPAFDFTSTAVKEQQWSTEGSDAFQRFPDVSPLSGSDQSWCCRRIEAHAIVSRPLKQDNMHDSSTRELQDSRKGFVGRSFGLGMQESISSTVTMETWAVSCIKYSIFLVFLWFKVQAFFLIIKVEHMKIHTQAWYEGASVAMTEILFPIPNLSFRSVGQTPPPLSFNLFASGEFSFPPLIHSILKTVCGSLLCFCSSFPLLFFFIPSFLQRCPTHLSWHHSHHAVAVPWWTKRRIWLPSVQELYVSAAWDPLS